LWHILFVICYLFAFAPLGRFFGGVAPVLRALPQAIAVSPLGFLQWMIFSAMVIFLNKIHPENAPKGQ
jgi:hypothetical protein